ncbi:SAM-dependent methyltransferase [Rhizorhabdus sp. FW153]|uniref:SAM-dependent methyltransferase n=1 Tax=Rhizorhabdus sp. FW153 TaxID=3400216 RepID=UPI003CF6A661
MNALLPLDDVEAQARAAWDIGSKLCTSCGAYHQIWGLMRLAGAVGGPKVDEDFLGPVLGNVKAGQGRILIAGAADAGLLQLVVHALPDRPLDVCVADRCPAPLALIDRIEAPDRVSIRTMQLDLRELTHERRYDLILSHSMLSFVPAASRAPFLDRLRRALVPGGTLLLVLRTAPKPTEAAALAHDDVWFERAMRLFADHQDLSRFAGPELPLRLKDYMAVRTSRLHAFHTPDEVTDLLREAGFVLVQHQESGESTRLEAAGQTIVKRSHIFVATT